VLLEKLKDIYKDQLLLKFSSLKLIKNIPLKNANGIDGGQESACSSASIQTWLQLAAGAKRFKSFGAQQTGYKSSKCDFESVKTNFLGKIGNCR